MRAPTGHTVHRRPFPPHLRLTKRCASWRLVAIRSSVQSFAIPMNLVRGTYQHARGVTHMTIFFPVHARKYLRLAPCAQLYGRYAVHGSLLRVLWAWFGAQRMSSSFCTFSTLKLVSRRHTDAVRRLSKDVRVSCLRMRMVRSDPRKRRSGQMCGLYFVVRSGDGTARDNQALSVRIFKQTLATHQPREEGSRPAGGSCRRPHHRCRRGHHRGGRTRPSNPPRTRVGVPAGGRTARRARYGMV